MAHKSTVDTSNGSWGSWTRRASQVLSHWPANKPHFIADAVSTPVLGAGATTETHLSPPDPNEVIQRLERNAGSMGSKEVGVTMAAAALGIRMMVNTRALVLQAASENSEVSEALNNLVVAYVLADWASVASLLGDTE
ncbi:hypothetical protein DL89DRAFT_258236 [Linderina pennispora]|uniref:Uncharacterized protein n=1 Tax=Linderina pennispora TaxID=61395 RepID=A0A1Y1W6L9_9FUNG|nr:uncharacterized protein DL89DRAFT_258236 [Linderina pennispora]ORX69169.1 hypothetical protein DL89DRAFT_258236 [Linderina pennispora]